MRYAIAILILLGGSTAYGETRCERLNREIAELEREIARLKVSINGSCRVNDDHEYQWGGKPYWNDPGRPTPVFPSPWAKPVCLPIVQPLYFHRFIGYDIFGRSIWEVTRVR